MHSLATTRRYWLPQLVLLGLLALAGTLPFWLTDLDLRVSGQFFHPDADNPWYQAQEPLWTFFYQLAPLLSALVTISSLMVLAIGSFVAPFRRLRLYAVFIIGVSVLGPGLLVNEVFKERWGRPRPHQLAAFQGTREYLPPLVQGESGDGKSFPCGHSSVGYALVVFVLIWLRRRPWLAAAALGVVLVVGGLLGTGRIVAGDHFLSDVIWSAVIVYAVALGLYYFALRIPQREDASALESPTEPALPRYPRLALVGYLLLGVAMLAAVLLLTPVSQTEIEKIRSGESSPPLRILRLTADAADVTVHGISGDGAVTAQVRLRVRGFGFPGSRVERSREVARGVVDYRIGHEGVFTEKDTRVLVGVVPGAWERVEVRTGKGDIRVEAGPDLAPVLDLETADGLVSRP
jgi:membrane-associated PAP2 superfamily phosphatase